MRVWCVGLAMLAAVAGGCGTPSGDAGRALDAAELTPPSDPVVSPAAVQAEVAPPETARPIAAGVGQDAVLETGLANLKTLYVQTTATGKELEVLKVSLSARQRGHFTSDETDRIEGLLFRYLACRDSLWDMVLYYGDCEKHFTGAEAQTKAFAIGYSAAVLLHYNSSRIVSVFVDDAMMIRKMNEIHGTYGIPAGTYDMLFDGVTSLSNVRALRDAHAFFLADARATNSAITRIAATEPVYAELLRENQSLYELAQMNTDYILKKKSLLLPAVANQIRQNKLLKQARKVQKEISDNLYVAQGILYNGVSDIKRPMSPPAEFSDADVQLIKRLIRPGDLLMTYSAGYMSNVALPGNFKHGITYVGTPVQRAAAGLSPDKAGDATPAKVAKLAKDLGVEKLVSGENADVIEAVAEGVIFNSLDYLLKHHINRLVILRPLVSDEDRAAALLRTFLMLGGQYDFNFDFSDASYICCTEAIYRAWNQRGGIDFKLVRRAAVQTLCADDIIQYHLAQTPPRFETILVAEEDPGFKSHRALVSIGAAADARLREMMTKQSLFQAISRAGQ